jgi:hypothetical protein
MLERLPRPCFRSCGCFLCCRQLPEDLSFDQGIKRVEHWPKGFTVLPGPLETNAHEHTVSFFLGFEIDKTSSRAYGNDLNLEQHIEKFTTKVTEVG